MVNNCYNNAKFFVYSLLVLLFSPEVERKVKFIIAVRWFFSGLFLFLGVLDGILGIKIVSNLCKILLVSLLYVEDGVELTQKQDFLLDCSTISDSLFGDVSFSTYFEISLSLFIPMLSLYFSAMGFLIGDNVLHAQPGSLKEYTILFNK